MSFLLTTVYSKDKQRIYEFIVKGESSIHLEKMSTILTSSKKKYPSANLEIVIERNHICLKAKFTEDPENDGDEFLEFCFTEFEKI